MGQRIKPLAVVTGASTGIGYELAKCCAGDGFDLVVVADPRLRSAAKRNAITEIETYEDHRIAMSLALAGLRIGGITILNPDCVGKTYPGYWDALRSLGVTLTAT